ncbi:VWA domain-containing protein [Agrobacterium sp. Ap1]|uniref:vWA domain-containing protein n=1 Tax=Agrobacterium sp. Ap1 TaxID=2815337 RepID=UPI001A8DD5BB|nr:VWA domain-containing protein [Agrobacterium sp. Ap1]MBO0141622.1 VWA domain-containing protein [Agrobacterium sp. Ap1]
MTDEFDRLRNNPPAPNPSEAARARAISAAMQVFDAEGKKAGQTQGKTQGKSWWHRQSSILNRIWSNNMITRHHYLAGSALATLLLVPSAAYLTFELNRGNPPVATGISVSQPAEVQYQSAAETASGKKKDFNADDVARLLSRENSAGGAARNVTAMKPQQDAAPAPAPIYENIIAAPPALRAAPRASAPGSDPAAFQSHQAGDRFANADLNPVKSVATDPVSTFSVDVDTASYSLVRRALMQGRLPDPDSVRVEEMVNYFPYEWPRPQSADTPFRTTVTVTPTPWNAGTQLMSVAIKGYDIAPSSAPPANLVFLIDVSGSMNAPDKLPLLKSAFRLLLGKLRPEDKVSIVTYAGSAGTVLEPTSSSERDTILNAIDTLQPGGSTAGAQGIEAAYDLARRAFIKDGVNRVMLATDGDFNVGASSDGDLKRLIEDRRRDGIYLSVLGFGEGNLNDSLMQTLAQNGNGTAAYIDTLAEAQKALVEEAGSTLFPIAKDVKIQVEFNPARIAEYRLIGYETRALQREDFNNDRVDAGDIGSGHAVTAIYEVTPKGSEAVLNDPLRYGKPSSETPASDELAFVKLRYKQPDGDTSRLITTAVTQANAFSDFNAAPQDVRFATAVAAFGQKLRGAGTLEAYSYGSILDIARNARGEDPFGYRSGFLDLVRLAETLKR